MQSNFWSYLLETTETIESSEQTISLNQLESRLQNIGFLYEKTFDPVDSFEAYVALKLINTISQTIQSNAIQENAI
ncbi:hypothetical protein Q4493_11395 [Colwellia sp. 1_MG-2023]|uniref:hypothetical protein n=1 Tax=Colwellia sp. 1_MG-2023 TaxID=3062649 RepID=UPI0026E3786C|nr:hypothetical protein [Colwellia sp. 1_MG-2023]MDO6446378.1 hypothetical protein [Colwellia sp. 1_MG-2023]